MGCPCPLEYWMLCFLLYFLVDRGYTEPPLTLWMCLVTLTVVLAVVSIVGTVLLLWKREASYQKMYPSPAPSQHNFYLDTKDL